MRLLISGVDLAKILCLTFTNAAADEMLNRITTQLKNWACISDANLIIDIRQLLGRNPSSNELQKARNLCYIYLQLQDNVCIQTIHGFCQRLLQRFPLEADINPYFTILDEFQTKEAINYISCSLASDNQLDDSLKFLASHCSEDKIVQLIHDIIVHHTKFSALIAKFPDGASYKLHLFDVLNLDVSLKNDIIHAFYAQFTSTHIRAYINQIVVNEGQDNHFILQLLHYQQQEYNEFVNNLPQIISLFITASGSKRRSLLNKSIKGRYSALDSCVASLQDQVVQLDNVINCFNIVESTYHFYVISIFVLNKYKQYKLDNHYLDYNDLIFNTYNLLQNKASRDWILYKLSTSIDHILIDESQDNSVEQWGIVLALLEDVLAGSTNKNYSSVFIVGDSKQSIFSFQGANLCIFNYLRKDLQKRFTLINKDFKFINLDTSYRSTQAILDFVQSVLIHINTSMPDLLEPSDLVRLKCSRNNSTGTVQLWDMVYNTNSKSTLQLSLPLIANTENTIVKTNLLAQQIASYIQQQILSKRVLPSTGQPISYNDFLILVRQRNQFVQQLVHALKSLNLKVAGMDRILLQEHLSIMDLIALAKFLITPNNDINFVSLIKSPIIGGSEHDIWFLCTQKPSSTSIWQFLLQMAAGNAYYQRINHKLQKFIELYRTTSPHYFFYVVIEVLNYRQILTCVNIEDGDDIIDEFLKVVTYFFTYFNPTIGDFITWFENNRIELKRDVTTQNSISIMTIHAAKGLQSPVVILPDTTTCPRHSANMLWGNEHDVLWLPQVKYLNNTYLHSCLKKNKYKDYQEYLRLLYVAMTRAQDELIICGCQMSNNISEKCWYSIARESILKISGIKLVQEKLGAVSINKIIYNK